MRQAPRLLVTCALCLLVLAGCTAFTYDANDLRGKSLTYSMDLINGSSPNGHDTAVFSFDDTGDGGSFECAGYTYDYATPAAFDAGEYTGKSWFMNDGLKGSFSYSPDARYLCLTVTSVYAVTEGATALDDETGLYAASDYSYQDLDAYLGAQYGSPVTGSSWSSTMTVLLTPDTVLMTYRATAAAYTWTYESQRLLAFTLDGTPHSHETTRTLTLVVKEGSISEDRKVVNRDTLRSTEPKTTDENVFVNAIDHAFIVGRDDGEAADFGDVWKEGNSVAFQVERTLYLYMYYTGDTAPASVSVDDSTGTGSASGTDWYCYTDMNAAAGTYDLTHAGTYVYDTDQAATAARSAGIGRVSLIMEPPRERTLFSPRGRIYWCRPSRATMHIRLKEKSEV